MFISEQLLNFKKLSQFYGVTHDSRNVKAGYIFVAIPGTRLDGRNFIREAIKKGASALVVPEADLKWVKETCNGKVEVIGVPNARKTLALLSSAFYGHPSRKLSLVGITGTNGKTTTTYILEAILNRAGKNPGVIGTVNMRIGSLELSSNLSTPDPVILQATLSEMLNLGARAAVMEVSSHGLDQERVTGCLFEAAVFTNLTHDHLDYHGDMEEYFKAKSTLFLEHTPKNSVINLDDPYGRRLWKIIGRKGISYGLDKEAMVRPVSYTLDISGIKATIALPDGEIAVDSCLLGRHNLYNILAAVSTAISLGISREVVEVGIRDVVNVPGRLERVEVKKGVTALVDYAHTPDALENILRCIRDLNPGRLICVMGCGGDRDKAKRPFMARNAVKFSDIAVFTSDNPRTEKPEAILNDMLKGIEGELCDDCLIKVILDRREAIRWGAARAMEGDCIVVAGKGHETYQIIGEKKYPFDDRMELKEAFKKIYPGLTLSQVSEATSSEIIKGGSEQEIKGISTDTRTISPGELFVALKGERFDGNKFAPLAGEKGASYVLIQGKDPALIREIEGRNSDTAILSASDTLKALGDLASWHRDRIGMEVVAVTGSCGKTTTKELVASVLERKWVTARTKGNFNNLIGLPLSILQASTATEWAVLEMGMNQLGEIERLCRIARPDVSVITTVQPAHLEGLGDVLSVLREKSAVWKALFTEGIAVVNLDDPLLVGEAKKLHCKRVAFSMNKPTKGPNFPIDAMITCRSWKPTEKGTILELDLNGSSLLFETHLVGRVNIQNILAAASVGYVLGLDVNEIRKGLGRVRSFPGRLFIRDLGKLRIIDDSYNANPASMKAALDVLKMWGRDGKKIAILGDMLELGKDAPLYHEEIGRYSAISGIDFLISAGEFSSAVSRGARGEGMPENVIHVFSDTEALVQGIENDLLGRIPLPCSILIKGSRGMRLERAVKAITKLMEKGRA